MKTACLLAAIALFVALNAHGACVNPLTAPSNRTPSMSWKELSSLKPKKALNSVITSIQRIDTDGVGDVNLDFYAVTIDANGQTPERLLKELRENIQSAVYAGTTYTVGPFDEDSKRKWDSTNPLGAVMVFTLAGFPVVPFERGAVVVSCTDAKSFVFSTVSIAGATNPEDHPVAGNRGFGVQKNADGSLMIYVKAADRRKGNNNTFAAMGSEKIFDLGADVWLGLLENLKTRYAARHPRNVIKYRRTEAYEATAMLTQPASPMVQALVTGASTHSPCFLVPTETGI